MKYSVEKESCDGDIKQERFREVLTFTRESKGKIIRIVEGNMTSSGYVGLSDLLDDLSIISYIDIGQMEG
jgi:hypothetical protein